MVTAAIIASIVSIVVALGSAGLSTWQVIVSTQNQQTKTLISNLISTINHEISSGRLKVSKLLSALTARNNQAVMQLLYTNPVIAKSMNELTADQTFIADVQAKQNSLESEIAALQDELRSMGYSNTVGGAKEEQSRAADTKRKIDAKIEEYNQLGKDSANYNVSTSRTLKPYTKDIDAISQNVAGGITK